MQYKNFSVKARVAPKPMGFGLGLISLASSTIPELNKDGVVRVYVCPSIFVKIASKAGVTDKETNTVRCTWESHENGSVLICDGMPVIIDHELTDDELYVYAVRGNYLAKVEGFKK